MAYPVIPENDAFGSLTALTQMPTVTANEKYSVYNKPFISPEYPSAKWVPANGGNGYVTSVRLYGNNALPANDDWLVSGANKRAAMMVAASDLMSRNRNAIIVRYACKQYAGFRMIDTPVVYGIDGKENPPPGCWGGFVMIGDFPFVNHDVGTVGSPYYLTMPTRGKSKDGRIRTALVHPVSHTEKNLSHDYGYPVGVMLNSHPCLQHDAVSNPALQPGWMVFNTKRHSSAGRLRYANYIYEQSSDADTPYPGNQSTKIVRLGGVGMGTRDNRYTAVHVNGDSCIDYINVADGGCVEVEYAGITPIGQPLKKWPLSAAVLNQNNRIVLNEITTNTGYLFSDNVRGTGKDRVENASSVLFQIKANNAIIKINIPNCNFLSGARAKYQHIYFTKIIGHNNKVIIHCGGAGLSFFAGEERTDEIYWYAGLCDNDTNEVIFTFEGDDPNRIFNFEPGPPNKCLGMYPIAKAVGSGTNAQNLWIPASSKLLNDAKPGWYAQQYATFLKSF